MALGQRFCSVDRRSIDALPRPRRLRIGSERAASDAVNAQVKIAALLLSLLLLGGCSSEGPADLPAIKGIRSAAAEWALVNREEARGRLTPAYKKGMRRAAREQIAKQARTLTQGSPAAVTAAALLALPADAPPEQIAGWATRLKQIEAALEPA